MTHPQGSGSLACRYAFPSTRTGLEAAPPSPMRTRRITWPAVALLAMAFTAVPMVKPATALTVSDVERQVTKVRSDLTRLSKRLDTAGNSLWRAQQAVISHNKALLDANKRKITLRSAIGQHAAELYVLGGQLVNPIGNDLTQLADQLSYLQQVDLGSQGLLEEIRALDARAVRESKALAKSLREARLLEREVSAQRSAVASRLSELTRLYNFLKSVNPASGGPVRGLWCPVAGPHALLNNWGDPRPGGPHTGEDMSSPHGTPVRAVLPGTISDVIHGGWVGIGIVLRDLAGNEYWYAHLSAAYVSPGERVSGGEVFGRVGCSGNCSGPHLHFEFHPGGGGPVNPHRLLTSAC